MSGMQPFRDKSLFILVTLLVISPKSFRTDDAVSYIYISDYWSSTPKRRRVRSEPGPFGLR
jgi:hypothetical protein